MLDLKTNQWEQLDYKGCHSPRSSHRMPMPSIFYVFTVAIYFTDLLVFDLGTFKMYGGYSKEVFSNKNCHSDMWLFDLKTWVRIKEAFALASTSSEENDWAGLLHLVKFYKN
ncbi:hypothetical protein LXL04_012346 [Taraxacum kok-saghyz]